MSRFAFSFVCITAFFVVGCGEFEESGSTMPLTADELQQGTGAGGAAEPVGEPSSEPGEVDADAPEEFQETASGLRYRVRRKSDEAKPTVANSVTVHYRGWLDDGTEFDSSYGGGPPATFGLNGVIKGWTEGLQLIGVGGMLELEIPSDLGYGPGGQGATIPPNATLHFTIELLSIQ